MAFPQSNAVIPIFLADNLSEDVEHIGSGVLIEIAMKSSCLLLLTLQTGEIREYYVFREKVESGRSRDTLYHLKCQEKSIDKMTILISHILDYLVISLKISTMRPNRSGERI